MAEDSAVARYAAEFLGTYLLVFTIGCNLLSGGPHAGIWAGTSIACVLMVMIYALGGVSGANFNPAVSLTLALSNKLPWKEAAIYTAVQLAAGISGAFSYSALFWKVFNLSPGKGFGWWEAWIAESVYTFMLCFVVLNVATAGKNVGNYYYGLAIGFVIVAGGYSVGNISGGAFNPAVALGIDLSSAGLGFGWGVAYVGYEILGAVLAAVLFRAVRPDEFNPARVDYSLHNKLVSEFIGTFLLVFTVGLNVLGNSSAAAWSIAACLMSMIYALGTCSGAHFNPAVTVAIICSGRGKCSILEGVSYIGVQILAGILAAFSYTAVHHGRTFPLAPGKIEGSGQFGYGGVAFAEITFTFVLCYVVLAVATTKRPSKDMFGLAIGSCVTVGGFAIGSISGGSLNPAVSLGISSSHILNFSAEIYKWDFWIGCLVWSGFETIGALLAAGLFRITHPSEYEKSLVSKV